MEVEFAGILVVPFIIACVGAAKGSGLPVTLATPLAVVLGIVLSVGYQGVQGTGAELWFNSAVVGVALGLAASGLYSGAKAVVEK